MSRAEPLPAPPPGADVPVLDATDAALIAALRADGRAPLGELGRQVRLSGDAVRERLRRLLSSGVVQIAGAVDPAALGYHTLALIAVRVRGPVEPLAAELVDVPEFDLVACTSGSYDLLIEAVCRDDLHLMRTLDARLRSQRAFEHATVFQYLDVIAWKPGGLAAPARPAAAATGAGEERPRVALGATDRAIMEILQRDGRASFQDVADGAGLSYANARRRAKALMDSGAVRIETTVNRIVEGTAVVAAVGLRTSGPTALVGAELAQLAEVEVAVSATGPFDLLLEVACRDRRHLAELVGERLRAIPGVLGSETFVYTRLLKLPVSWSGLVPRP